MTKLCCQKNVSTTYVLVRNREFVQLLKQLRTFHGTFMRGNSIGFSNLEVTHVRSVRKKSALVKKYSKLETI